LNCGILWLTWLYSIVTIHAMYLRTVKVRSSSGTVHEYVRIVEAHRQDGKVRQRVVADLGRKDLLATMLPKLRRLLAGQALGAPYGDAVAGQEPVGDVEPLEAATWGPMLVVRTLAKELGLTEILHRLLRSGQAQDDGMAVASAADRVIAMIANLPTGRQVG